MGRSLKSAVALTVVSAVAGCSSAQKSAYNHDSALAPSRVSASADAARVPSSFTVAAMTETQYRTLVSEGPSARLIESEFVDRLLRILYRAEHYVSLLDGELDAALEKKKAGQEVGNLFASENYKQLLNLWYLSDVYKNQISSLYNRLLEAKNDPSTSVAERQMASDLAAQLSGYVSSLAPEDRVELVDLIEKLEEKRLSSDTDFAGKTDSAKARSTASLQGFGKAILKGKEATEVTRARQAVIREKANAAVAYNDPMLEPTLVASGSSGEAPPFKPSEGKDGNVFGRVFPKGTYVLTFDDGPKTATTSRLLDILAKHRDSVNKNGAGASFFWLASLVKGNAQMIEKAAKLGYAVNNHSWDHANLAKLGAEGLNKQIVESTSVIKQATGKPIRFFRCPYGACYAPAVPAARKLIAQQGMIHAYWAIDSTDWQNKSDSSKTYNFVVKQMNVYSSGIILFHDIHEKSVDAVEQLLAYIKQQNDSGKAKIRLLSLEQAVDEVNKSVGK